MLHHPGKPSASQVKPSMLTPPQKKTPCPHDCEHSSRAHFSSCGQENHTAPFQRLKCRIDMQAMQAYRLVLALPSDGLPSITCEKPNHSNGPVRLTFMIMGSWDHGIMGSWDHGIMSPFYTQASGMSQSSHSSGTQAKAPRVYHVTALSSSPSPPSQELQPVLPPALR